MAVTLIAFRRVYVEQADADALPFHDYVQRVAIDHVRYTTVKRRGISVECEQQDG